MSIETAVRTRFEYPGRDAWEFDHYSRPAVAGLVKHKVPEDDAQSAVTAIGRAFDGREVQVFATGPEIFVVRARGSETVGLDQTSIVARFSSKRVRFSVMEPEHSDLDVVQLGSATPADAAAKFSAYVERYLGR
ncbi:hypothetical protein [Cellulomonas sp. PhB143]|uniref:hypothetical protein n=1 Tax=Cellulomonas sp. PhB143 TaxID=2485186 RepID=UPI000F4ADB4D|nr:hypothetical protein [Cellulomonas sp. PhB143]ROS78710.1 hypothetical protein EDF32_0615 [Cellulomonas sp. PhB143]